MLLLLAALLFTLSAAASAQTKDVPEPNVQRTVVEDDGARIEELRVRGQLQRVVVKPKNAAEYEIVTGPGGRDPSVGRSGNNWTTFFFLCLISLITTLHDRYQPIYAYRRAQEHEGESAPGESRTHN